MSLNSKLFVSGDVSLNSKLFVSGDVSLNSKLTVTNDVSLNSKLFVSNDVSLNSKLFVSGDVSLNSNLNIGNTLNTTSIQVSIDASNMDIATTQVGGTLNIGTNGSRNGAINIGNGGTGKFINIGGNNGGTTTINSQWIDLGSPSTSRIQLNPTASGTLNLGNSITGGTIVLGNAMTGGTLTIGPSISSSSSTTINIGSGSAYTGPINIGNGGSGKFINIGGASTTLTMSGNTKVGSGSSSVAINKDISSAFALDVSGITQIRGNLDVAGIFTVNGAPVSGGGTLTGNVQVGTNSGFVTIDKPQFYSDPSLTIYYDFDSASYTGTTIANKGNGGATLTATLQGTSTGMIDTGNFYLGTASLRNDTITSLNQGIKVNSSSIPIGTNMSFSFWLRKKSKPPGTDSDRIFEYSTNSAVGAVGENNSIALDISSSGIILPVLTGSGGNQVTSCFGTLSAPIISYNVCDDAWKHIIWSINGSLSTIYVNGSITQQDTITGTSPFAISSTRVSAMIGHSTVTSVGGRDFSGNIDDFRYYKDKVLSYPEIYQLYNNNFYTLDICGGFLANGPSVIYEPVGSVATANSGSLTLLHGNAGGSSSIMFKSTGGEGDYAYIEYDEHVSSSVQSIYKWDLSRNVPSTWSNTATFASTGILNTALSIFPSDSSFNWLLTSQTINPPSNFGTYCISFNQTNVTQGDTTSRLNYLQMGINYYATISVSLWIYPTLIAVPDNYIIIASFSNGTNVTNNFEIAIDGNNRNLALLFNNIALNFATPANSISLNQWYHVVCTYNDATNIASIYLNGSLSVRQTAVQINPYSYLLFGMRWGESTGTGTKGFRGGMSFINIFNYELTASDIAYLYNNPGYTPSYGDRGVMTIGIENETGYINSDSISLWPGGGRGFVGLNTKTPTTTLDVSGQMRIYEGVGTVANPGSGTLMLEHANAGGTSSLVFKGPNSTTSDYAYVQYEDNNTIPYIQSVYKWNLSPGANITYGPSATVDTSVGSNTTATLLVGPASPSQFFSVLAPSPPSTFPSNTYCISFNQTNQTGTPGTGNINYIQGDVAAMQQNISFSFWIRPNITWDTTNLGGGAYYAYYIAHVSNGTSTSIIDFYIRGYDQKLFVLINGNGTNYKTTNSVIQNNVWTHVAFTYSTSPNNGYIYINGIRDELTIGTGYTAIGALNAYNSILFGMRWGYNGGADYMKGFRGHMNFINIFNQTLTDSNILNLYNNPSYGQTTEGGLMTIGIENDSPYNDRITLWPNSGTGYVGINTKTPQATLDVSGTLNINGIITNNSGALGITVSGKILISEAGAGTTGNVAVGSLTLQHQTNGASSIVFRSATNFNDYGYIRYQDHVSTTNFNGTNENGLLTIGIENDGTSSVSADRIVLWACDNGTSNATGYVGINTKNPLYTLDVNGNVNATSYNASSDYRIKENVMPLDLQFNVDVLKPVSYVLKNDKDAKLQIGFIAHEVQEFYPFLVNGNKDGPNTQSINYNGFIGILTKEIQYLKKKVLDQEARIMEQEAKALAKAAEQDQRIQALEKMVLDLINK